MRRGASPAERESAGRRAGPREVGRVRGLRVRLVADMCTTLVGFRPYFHISHTRVS